MHITSTFEPLPPDAVAHALGGLPPADGYAVHVKPLRYRQRPHLSAWTDFDERSITLQVPEPFFPFGEIVPYAAKRRPGKGLKFIWLTEGVTFRTPREVLRFLYCHEWMHWYLREELGRKSAAETACDRFALRNYRRRTVTIADAEVALRKTRSSSSLDPPQDRVGGRRCRRRGIGGALHPSPVRAIATRHPIEGWGPTTTMRHSGRRSRSPTAR